MEKIKYVGIDELSIEENEMIKRLSEEYLPKIERAIRTDVSLVVHVKTHHETGKRKQYEFIVRTISTAKTFEASCSEWDLAGSLHKAFQKLEKEIEHRYRDK